MALLQNLSKAACILSLAPVTPSQERMVSFIPCFVEQLLLNKQNSSVYSSKITSSEIPYFAILPLSAAISVLGTPPEICARTLCGSCAGLLST